MKAFKPFFGHNGQFVLLENRAHWLPVNDANWDDTPAPDAEFFVDDATLFPPDEAGLPLTLPDNVKIFGEEAQKIEQQRLEALALAELAKNLKAAQHEYDLEAQLEKIDFHLNEDKFFP
ncbi:hypothetical protein [Neisseria chenwenguii]|uniref:Uncharacterized protein n=1 Tax=Neisseria chenwenguii TaxID=1853278 RepID=A0A220S446_9NEIS|nr:hypothetical protein [Neisseria chenwenguii]ASK28274.1 hypothetical protein BG910_11505 [Neisseria chenwenguii]ROV57399.1 hypothetical protein EGS38_01615 [Neisseria chenwenguii]